MRMRPRILYVSPYWPHRGTCASELRALHVLRALQEIGGVQVVVVDTEGGGEEWTQLSQRAFDVAYSVKVSVRVKRDWKRKLQWATDPWIQYPHGCGVDVESTIQVLQSAREVDLVWFSKLRTPNMFANWAWPHAVVDIDDVPSTYDLSVLQSGVGFQQRLLNRMRIRSWVRRERLLGERFTVLGVCSEGDKQYLERLGIRTPMHVIPNGYELPAEELVRKPATPPRIGFIGIFDYEPNLQGIRWFVEKCWPRIKYEFPDARLRLVGRQSDGLMKPDGHDIDGLGWVKDVASEMSSWSAMIVPIRTGAGTRGKIVHGFSQKCPIVSTRMGAYGYEATDGVEIFLADDAEEFSSACIRAIREPLEAAAMAERAWQKFLEKWTWEAIRPSIWAAAEDCLRRSASALVKPATVTLTE